jgi:hypothetical protein
MRRYNIDGIYPHPLSVTTLIKTIAPAEQLSKWVDKKVARGAIEAFQKTQDVEVSVSAGLNARWSSSEESNLGNSVHYLTEVEDLKTLGRHAIPDVVADVKKAEGYARQWVKAREEHNMEILAVEVTLLNRELGYAGTADRVVICPSISHDPIILDLKSGKGIYPDVALQCAALANCDEILFDNGTLEKLPWDINRSIGLAAHVRPRSCRLIPLDLEKAWPYFKPLPMLAAWRAEQVKVLDEPIAPNELESLRASLRLRIKSLPKDLKSILRDIIASDVELEGTSLTWNESQLSYADNLFKPFEMEALERKQKILDSWGTARDVEMRLEVLRLTGGSSASIEDLTAAQIDQLLEANVVK